MLQRFFILLVAVFPFFANATTLDCKNVYIGTVWMEKGVGLKGVVYMNHPGNSSGSYVSNFEGWGDEDKKQVLSLLLSAKASKRPVTVRTENAGGCGIQQGGTTTKSVYLAPQTP
ncbi:hypothetical protein ACVBE9_02615 [Eionea flava]